MPSVDELHTRLSNPRPGGVVLFTGAGFSVGAKNDFREQIPLAKDFASKISTKIGLPSDTPLTLAAELYNESLSDDRAFLKFLKRSFKVSEVEKTHRDITAYPWRRIYTTNYDNVIEFIDPKIESLERDRLAFELEKGTQIVHLNGSVLGLRSDSNLDDFQLIMTHYFDRDLFDTAWASTFRSDLELCHSIVFAGYSMYDPDISKIVFEDPALKSKSFIIQRTDLPEHEERWLSKFGTVLKIGNDGLGKMLSAIQGDGGPRISQAMPENFSEYLVERQLGGLSVRQEDVAALLERGIFSREKLEASRSRKSPTYVSERSAVHDIIDAFKKGVKNVLIHADMGNGKSVIVEAASRELVGSLGKQVFFYEGQGSSLDFDINAFSQIDESYVLVFDGFFDNQKEIELFRSQLSNALILATERTASFELRKADIGSLFGSSFYTVDVNKLSPNDVEGVIGILDSGAYWSEKVGASSFSAKKKIIEKECSSEISSLLVGIVKSSVFKLEISQKLKKLSGSDNSAEFDLVCGAMLLSFIGCPTHYWLMSELLGRDMFSVSRTFQDESLRQFFSIGSNEVSARSPMLAEYILREIVDDSFLMQLNLEILRRSSDRHKRAKIYRSINSRLLQFKNIDKIIKSKNNRYDIINRFYFNAGELGYKEFSPPYWSQYAIAARSFKDFRPADRFFKEAQRIAFRRSDYYSYKVDNAYAQFLLESRTMTDIWSDYVNAFLDASGIALSQTSIRQAGNYPYKVAGYFAEFADRRASEINNRERKLVLDECVRWFEHFKNVPDRRRKNKLVKRAKEAVSYTYDAFSS